MRSAFERMDLKVFGLRTGSLFEGAVSEAD